jgi:uncharacterized protein (TIGR02594 family)
MMTPLKIALTQYGIKEIPGVSHEPEVIKYFHDCGFTFINDDETPWCSAFMSWCFMKAGIAVRPTLRSRDWLQYGTPVFEPILGDVAIFSRRGNPEFGHVAFYINQIPTHIYVLGGNQSNMVNIQLYFGVDLLGYRRIV